VLTVSGLSAAGAELTVVNPSFESPQTEFVATQATGWTIAGPPETGVGGVFANVPQGTPGHISNAIGNQLALLSSQSGNEFSQVLSSSFEAGQQYRLSVGIAISASVPPQATDTLRLGLFYLDAGSQRQLVAFEDVANSAGTLSDAELRYFDAQTPLLPADHPAVGRPIGVLLASTGLGGFFDMDDVSVSVVPEPGAVGVAAAALWVFRRRRIG
jgi:hypothetical protein